jgi:hypothetical protein
MNKRTKSFRDERTVPLPRLDLDPHCGVIAEFPFRLRIGAYRFSVRLVDPSVLPRRNELTWTDYNHQTISLSCALDAEGILRSFLRRVILSLHYVHGVDSTSNEETFTHSFAGGLVHFATDNPDAWIWINQMLDLYVGKGNNDFARTAHGLSKRRRARPQRLLIRERSCRVVLMDRKISDRERRWGDYSYETGDIRFCETLVGVHKAIIFWHEVVHGIHHQWEMTDRNSLRNFARAQSEGMLSFVRKNPGAWHWLLQTLNEAAGAADMRAKAA